MRRTPPIPVRSGLSLPGWPSPGLLIPALLIALTGCPEEPPAGTDSGPRDPVLAILSFTATPTTVAAGGSVTLAWETTGAARCSIEPDLGTVPREGSADRTLDVSTSFSLTCSGAGGEVTEGVFVSVSGGQDGGPLGDGGPLDSGPTDAGPAIAGFVSAHALPLPADLTDLVGDDLLQVFTERTDFVLPEDLPCGAHVATQYVDDTYLHGGSVPAGTRVDVFFLRAASTTREVFDAELTFAREVLCVMPTDETLNASQIIVAAPGTIYPSLDPDGGVNDGSGVNSSSGDTFSLSADRRTVAVSYITPLDSLSRDDTRVIVAAVGQGSIEIRAPTVVRTIAPGRDLTGGIQEAIGLQLLDEATGVTVGAPLLIDAIAPGEHRGGADGGPQAMLPSGTYDVAILHFDPQGDMDQVNRVRGTVTFDRTIRGIALSTDAHANTTPALMAPFTWSDSHNLEDDDVVEWFNDGRSFYLDLVTVNPRAETVRVLLDPAP